MSESDANAATAGIRASTRCRWGLPAAGPRLGLLGVMNAGPPYTGTWGVACENEGEAIEFKLTKNAVNCLKLYPQKELEGVDLSNSGEGAGRSVGLDAEIEGLEYEWVGVCGKNLVRTDGVMSGESTLSAADEGGAQIGAWLSGVE